MEKWKFASSKKSQYVGFVKVGFDDVHKTVLFAKGQRPILGHGSNACQAFYPYPA